MEVNSTLEMASNQLLVKFCIVFFIVSHILIENIYFSIYETDSLASG
jgi:hypothetical protein